MSIRWDLFWQGLLMALIFAYGLNLLLDWWALSLLIGSLAPVCLTLVTFVNDQRENSRCTVAYALSASICMVIILATLIVKGSCLPGWFGFGSFIIWIGVLRPITTMNEGNIWREIHVQKLRFVLHLVAPTLFIIAIALKFIIGE